MESQNDKEKQEILLNYRIAYRGETMVNWCAALGTVLANDEVVNGVSGTWWLSGGTKDHASVVPARIRLCTTASGWTGDDRLDRLAERNTA